jgi:hypothetical protein
VLTLRLKDPSQCATTLASNDVDLIVVVTNNTAC